MYGGTTNNGTVFEITLPLPPSPPQPLGFVAICNTTCFENTLKWRLPPPVWVLGSNGAGFVSIVQKVSSDGRTVEFSGKKSPSLGNPAKSAEWKIGVTFARATKFKPGQRWLLVAKGPVTGLSPKVELLGFWPVESSGKTAPLTK
jgi:hypothetical protein